DESLQAISAIAMRCGGWGGGYGGWGGDGGYDTEPRYDETDTPPDPPPPVSPCELDAAKDSAAQSLADEIKAKADWNSREYGGLILRDSSGYIWFSELQAGETVAEALARATAAGPGADYAPQTHLGSVPAGYTVVGAVHSHSDIGYDAAGDAQNMYPSAGDYSQFDALVGIDSRFSSGAQFTQYIVGPDGVLREYDFTEGHVTPLNDTKAATRSDLASDRPCH
ncbi:MAG: DUF4329 domain-containing protein, partial [Allosphingosinicella sp.]